MPANRNESGQFVKGQSGNPTGRPKVDQRATEAAKEHTELAINTLVEICRNKKAADNSRVAAARHLLDRAWGCPRQAVDLPDGVLPAFVPIQFVDPADAPGDEA